MALSLSYDEIRTLCGLLHKQQTEIMRLESECFQIRQQLDQARRDPAWVQNSQEMQE